MAIGLGATAALLLVGLVLMVCLYLETKNNIAYVEEENRIQAEEFEEKIKEKDELIQNITTEKETLEANISSIRDEYDEKLKESQKNLETLEGKTTIDNDSIKHYENTISELNGKVKDYQLLTNVLLQDMHELEDKYIQNGGALSDVYEDYDEYYN